MIRISGEQSYVEVIFSKVAQLQTVGMALLRWGLILVLLWIGGITFAGYEADSIVPFVANSPMMSFFYKHSAPDYRKYMNKEGELVPAHRAWHESNGTYLFARLLGTAIVGIGLLIALHPVWPQLASFGSFLLIGMACVTLSFLFTTPEAWVPALGDAEHGFPYLSGAGRLVVKDFIMLGAAVLTMANSAAAYVQRKQSSKQSANVPMSMRSFA